MGPGSAQPPPDSSRTGKLPFILLRNLQNNRISCPDVTSQEDLPHAIQPLFFSRPKQAGPWVGPTFLRDGEGVEA